MKADVLIVTLTFFCGILVYTNACSCMRNHPQQQYCKSDFVILARVRRELVSNDKKIYKVRVRKEYKVTEKGLTALKSGRLITASEDSMCGSSLKVGKLYVLSGRIFSLKAYINICNMQMEWNTLTRRQRKGLKLMYRQGCTCNIKYSPWLKVKKDKDTCVWKSNCEEEQGVCLRHANKSCMWTRTKALTHCWKEQRTKERIEKIRNRQEHVPELP